MLREIDEVLENAVQNEDVPFIVGMVANKNEICYSGSSGDATEGTPAGLETVFRIFSMTKAVGALAAAILMDRGKLALDTPVEKILPDFGKLMVLEGFENDNPIMRKPKVQATIRHLATHTSGLEYEFWNKNVFEYMSLTGHPTILSGLKKSLFYPMTSDPGTRWGYGISIDWLGQVVEAIDGRSIDKFCKDEIFEPLGMNSTDFELSFNMQSRLADIKARGEDGRFELSELMPPSEPEVYGMGHSLFSTAPDYIRFLRMFLRGGELDGNQILSQDMLATMTSDLMQGLVFEKMCTIVPPTTADVDPFPGTKVTHSFAFLRNEEQILGKRSAGSLTWAGVLNTHYWLDPAKGIAAVIMTQSLPFVEERFMNTYDSYEKAVYANI